MDKEELKQNYASIHTLRMEGDFESNSAGGRVAISIHTLRVEGDYVYFCVLTGKGISIHTLRMEGDLSESARTASALIFQSTPSAWRVTA